jgi:hypothetical protein
MIKKIKSFLPFPSIQILAPPRIQPKLFHSRPGQEVDIVPEDPKGWPVGIDVKTATVVWREGKVCTLR